MKDQNGFQAYVNDTPSDSMQNKLLLVCSHTADGTYTAVSESSEKMLGYPADELIGKNPYDFFHPDDQEFIKTHAHELALENKMHKSVIYRFRSKSGEYVKLETITYPLLDDKKGVVSLGTISWLVD